MPVCLLKNLSKNFFKSHCILLINYNCTTIRVCRILFSYVGRHMIEITLVRPYTYTIPKRQKNRSQFELSVVFIPFVRLLPIAYMGGHKIDVSVCLILTSRNKFNFFCSRTIAIFNFEN